MGSGASLDRPLTHSGTEDYGRQRNIDDFKVLETSLQGASIEANLQRDTRPTVEVEIKDQQLIVAPNCKIESDSFIHFKVIDRKTYDVIQVYKKDKDFYVAPGGFWLRNISSNSPDDDSKILVSFNIRSVTKELRFCVVPVEQVENIYRDRKCPREYCQDNYLKIERSVYTCEFDDSEHNEKIYLSKQGELVIESKAKGTYRFEEKKYCPVSGGFYSVPIRGNDHTIVLRSKEKLIKSFPELCTSFICRYNQDDELVDTKVINVDDTLAVKTIKITDNKIEPNLLYVEVNDIVEFSWKSKKPTSLTQINPNSDQPLDDDQNLFSWPFEPTEVGLFYHRFDESGLFCFKTHSECIGTIIVMPQKRIHRLNLQQPSICKMEADEFVDFSWSTEESERFTFEMRIDRQSSIIPQDSDGLQTVFRCNQHRCSKNDLFFKNLYQCKSLIFKLPMHGVYQVITDSNDEVPLYGFIVENSADEFKAKYDENCRFLENTIIVNRNDTVWFDSNNDKVASIYETDPYGILQSKNGIFQPRLGSVNCFARKCTQTGIFYFRAIYDDEKKLSAVKSQSQVLAIVVLPEVKFRIHDIDQDDYSDENQPVFQNVEAITNDFIIWKYTNPMNFNVQQISGHCETFTMDGVYESMKPSRSRLCAGVECTKTGSFYFAIPLVASVDAVKELRLVTVVIDLPFDKNKIIIKDEQAFPDTIFITKNETVSFAFISRKAVDSIHIGENTKLTETQTQFFPRNIMDVVKLTHHLHTFTDVGAYPVRIGDSDDPIAQVIVLLDDSSHIPLPKPEFSRSIGFRHECGDRIDIYCESQKADIYYTLDGSSPTEYFDNISKYDKNTGIILDQIGLRIIRAYAVLEERLSSEVATSQTLFIKENEEMRKFKENAAQWNSMKLQLECHADGQNLTKVYNKITVFSAGCASLIKNFRYLINSEPYGRPIECDMLEFSSEGFSAGKTYRIAVCANPKDSMEGMPKMISNSQTIEIPRETLTHGPLISLFHSTDPNTLILTWAHIGDHVLQYDVYADDLLTTTVDDMYCHEGFCINLTDCKADHEYKLHVDAKLKNQTKQSNILRVKLPTPDDYTNQMYQPQRPYIVMKKEPMSNYVPRKLVEPLSDDENEGLLLYNEVISNPSKGYQREREYEAVNPRYPIDMGLRTATPTIRYKRNRHGITLFWNKCPPDVLCHLKNYCIMLNDKQYGRLIDPDEEPIFHINLPNAKHELYVTMITKDGNQPYNSNVLKPPKISKSKDNSGVGKSVSKEFSYDTVSSADLPIPELHVQHINTTTIRAIWRFDRGLPPGCSIAIYQVHIRGLNFMDPLESDGCIQDDDYSEHVWFVTENHIEIHGIPNREEFNVFVRALFYVEGTTDLVYLKTVSKEISTIPVDPLIDSIPRPIVQVKEIGLLTALISWNIDKSFEKLSIKGYRVSLNSSISTMVGADDNEYRLENLKPGTTTEVTVAATTHPDFIEEKISEPITIVCPDQPKAPVIQRVRTEEPYSIAINWNLVGDELESVTKFKAYLDGDLHGEVDSKGRQTFKYYFKNLRPNHEYSIYVKSVIGQKKLDGVSYQCSVESKPSQELVLKCNSPPRGTIARIIQMNEDGVEISWDPPTEYEEVSLTGYQVLKDGRVYGKLLGLNERQLFINDLKMGNRYSLQILPITDQPGAQHLRTGEVYDSDRHGHFLPGPKVDVDFTDFAVLPEKIWVENVRGRSAVICWTPIDKTKFQNSQPDGFKLVIWNDKTITKENPIEKFISNEEKKHVLDNLDHGTIYEFRVVSIKKRSLSDTDTSFTVLSSSDIVSFETGLPPEGPSNISLVACTNNAARFKFDPFVEHRAEIITLRVVTEAITAESNKKEIILDLTPDSKEFTLTNLFEKTSYRSTIYAITEEYLKDVHCRDVAHLSRKPKSSEWLSEVSIEFITGGCDAANNLVFHSANSNGIQMEWQLPKAYGSAHLTGQIIRYKLNDEQEKMVKLDRSTSKLTVPGVLTSGLYTVYLDSWFSIKVNLEEDNDTGRQELRLTKSEMILVEFVIPSKPEGPLICISSYTTDSIDICWNKPNMFEMIDHPEKPNEKLYVHRELTGYKLNVNRNESQNFDPFQNKFTLVNCKHGTKYTIELFAQSKVKTDIFTSSSRNDKSTAEIQEAASNELNVYTLNDDDFITSFCSSLELKHNEVTTNTENKTQKQKQMFGSINVSWAIGKHHDKKISYFILKYFSSKDLKVIERKLEKTENSAIIEVFDEKYVYSIDLIVVDDTEKRHFFPTLSVPVPGRPDSPKLWLYQQTNNSFIVEWSEPRSYGIPIIGYQIFVEGRKPGDNIDVRLRRAEIASRINHTYQVTVQAVTNHSQYPYSEKSQVLTVVTAPMASMMPKLPYHNDDGITTSFDNSIARIIPVQIEAIDEERIHIDWESFLPTAAVRCYYVHATCLNTGNIKVTKIPKRTRETVLQDLRPGFTYGILVIAVDKNGAVLYTSDKKAIQMSAPPNAPDIRISQLTTEKVKIEWSRPAAYGDLDVIGYRVYVNNRLAATLAANQSSYTLINGTPCDTYNVQVRALTKEKNIDSPLSQTIEFRWPGIKPGTLRRVDDGQQNIVQFCWDHPTVENNSEKLVCFKLYTENLDTYASRLLGEYDAGTNFVTINNLTPGKHRFWLEIIGEKHRTQTRPVIINFNRSALLDIRQTPTESIYGNHQRFDRLPSTIKRTISPFQRRKRYT